jgi:uncharacterized OB-fold protein
MSTKERVAAVDGWFTLDDADPRLLGNRCTRCGSYFFPKASVSCRNPSCDGTELEEVPLSNRGTIWSFTTNHYAPPAPYVAPDPFEPFSIAAVELPKEKMVVLGQVAEGVDPATLRVGTAVHLTLGTLFEDDEHEYVVWKWSPIEGARADG